MHGRLRLITPPAMEPVTLAEAKLHARIDHDLEDGLLATFIAAARQHGEQLTGRQFVEAAYELSLDGFPCGDDPIELPKPPLQAVESISFVDRDGARNADHVRLGVCRRYFRVCWPPYPAYGRLCAATRRPRNALTSASHRLACHTGNRPLLSIKSWMLCRVTASTSSGRASPAIRQRAPRRLLDGLLTRAGLRVVRCPRPYRPG